MIHLSFNIIISSPTPQKLRVGWFEPQPHPRTIFLKKRVCRLESHINSLMASPYGNGLMKQKIGQVAAYRTSASKYG